MLNSVTNALRMLDYLVEKGEGGVTEMARELEISPGAAYRLVATLVSEGYVEQNAATKRYAASIKILEHANVLRGQFEFLDLAREHLVALAKRTEETVNLGVLRNDRVTYVDRVVSNQPVSVEVQKGSVVPAYCTGLGKVMLARSEPAYRASYLQRLAEISADDGRDVPEAKVLEKELDAIATRGYAEDVGEFSPEIRCIAAPVLDEAGHAVAAVSVTGPLSRISSGVDRLVPMVEIAAKELTLLHRALGAQGLRV